MPISKRYAKRKLAEKTKLKPILEHAWAKVTASPLPFILSYDFWM
jgi:hypothetical protein